MDGALCKGLTEDFVPYLAGNRKFFALAKNYCAKCPVLDSCRELSYELHPVAGLWAGLTAADRDEIVYVCTSTGKNPAAIRCLCETRKTSRCFLHS
jgi:hypothetical protein